MSMRFRILLPSLGFLCLATIPGANAQTALIAIPPPLSANSRNGDPLVVGTSTGLTWADTPSPAELSGHNLVQLGFDAPTWVQSLNTFHGTRTDSVCVQFPLGCGYGGYTDWRLPSITEMAHLFNELGLPTFAPFVDLNPHVVIYWSSSDGPLQGEVWVVATEGLGWYPSWLLESSSGPFRVGGAVGGGGALAVRGTQTAPRCVAPTNSTGAWSVIEVPPAGTYPTIPPTGLALNGCGDVTGAIYPFGYTIDPHVFVYKNGTTVDLADDNNTSGAIGYGINSSDVIAGVLGANLEAPGFFTWYETYFYNVSPGNIPAYSATASAINTNGLVTGTTFQAQSGPNGCPAGGYDHPFQYDSNNPSATGVMDLSSSIQAIGACSGFGLAINDSGQIAGYFNDSGSNSHAYVYSNGTATDLGNLGYQYAVASGINVSGDVTGYSSRGSGGSNDAFLYKKGQVCTAQELARDPGGPSTQICDIGTLGGPDLDGLGTQANAINASDQVTGRSWTTGNALHAFLYSNGTMQDLNTLVATNGGTTAYCTDTNSADSTYGKPVACTLVKGMAINDAGQILVQGYFNSNHSQAVTFLLTPPPAALTARLNSSSVDGSGNYIENIVITNTGSAPANTPTLTLASLVVVQSGKAVTIPASTALPAVQNSLAPGATASLMLTFPPTAGSAGAAAALRWSAAYTGGSASGTLRLALP